VQHLLSSVQHYLIKIINTYFQRSNTYFQKCATLSLQNVQHYLYKVCNTIFTKCATLTLQNVQHLFMNGCTIQAYSQCAPQILQIVLLEISLKCATLKSRNYAAHFLQQFTLHSNGVQNENSNSTVIILC